MMSHSSLSRLSAVAAALLLVVAWTGSAWAVPDLQVWFDPALNDGTVSYDNTTDTTIIEGSGGEVELTLFATDDAFDVGNTNQEGILIVSLDGFDQFTDPNGLVNVTVEGTALTWVYGTPPIGYDPAPPNSDSLPTHGQFPTWYAQYDVVFDTATSDIPDVQTGEVSNEDGWREDLTVAISGEPAGVHFDLATLDYYPNPGTPVSPTEIYAFAPFSHDAEVPPVPEPGSLALFAVGSLVAYGANRRRRSGEA